MTIHRALVATLATLTLAGCASKSRWDVTPEQRAATSPSICLLSSFPHNADGSITAAQVQAGIAARFAADDTNGDGKLTYEEISRVNQARQGTCDTTSLVSWNGTGVIEMEEYGARYETAFIAADRNIDGLATVAELAAPMSDRERAAASAKRQKDRTVTPETAKSDPSQVGMPGSMPGSINQGGY